VQRESDHLEETEDINFVRMNGSKAKYEVEKADKGQFI